eukprot:scaffold64738_cov66-Cyclotella_meneghiniana.AAC.3
MNCEYNILILTQYDASSIITACYHTAAGRSVKRSGLRDTGGIYLVSVYRAATGNVHRAVGQQFVINVDDILYFTGMVEGFASFCQEHALKVITNELNVDIPRMQDAELRDSLGIENGVASVDEIVTNDVVAASITVGEDRNKASDDVEQGGLEERNNKKTVSFASSPGQKVDASLPLMIDTGASFNRRCSLVSANLEKKQAINRISDLIRGEEYLEPLIEESMELHEVTSLAQNGPAKIVVTLDNTDLNDIVTIGVNASDRPGLLQDISGNLHSLGLQLHHTEAAVVSTRSFSVWRCELFEFDDQANLDADEILNSLQHLLNNDGRSEAVKRLGLSVVRAVVTDQSRLSGKSMVDVDFRQLYKAAIIAVQKADKSDVSNLSQIVFASGDILVIQAEDDSPLLIQPPDGFYDTSTKGNKKFLKGLAMRRSNNNLKGLDESQNARKSFGLMGGSSNNNHASQQNGDLVVDIPNDDEPDSGHPTNSSASDPFNVGQNEVWNDLRVLFPDKKGNKDSVISSREYLTAMTVAPKAAHIGKTLSEAGLDKLIGIFVVQVERPDALGNTSRIFNSMRSPSNINRSLGSRQGSISIQAATTPIPPSGRLQEGDIIWFAGDAAAIADLRKIPGLVSSQEDELKQIDEALFDRRLVQAVIAKKGPLVGKTAAEVGFRTRYGAAVIAVHRDGTRVQDHPGKVKLQAGDVLLLEAGPTFIANNQDNQHSFALISEVKDSKPPRLNKLIPATVMVVLMLALVTVGISSLLVLSMCTVIVMVSTGIISQQECRDAVNWDVFTTIASAFGIGIALTNSGLANLLANGLVAGGEALGIGVAGLYGAVYLATVLISNIVTNNAAAALMFPIAMEAADQVEEADPILMSYNLMLAASASFMSPFGYTTNLLIYGPGGYTTKDFLRFGTPMQLVLWILTTVILSNTSRLWYISWIWTFGVFCLAVIILVFSSTIKANCCGKKDKEEHDHRL